MFSSEPLCVISEPEDGEQNSNPLYAKIKLWVSSESWECDPLWYWCCLSMVMACSEKERLAEMLKQAKLARRDYLMDELNPMREIAKNILDLPLVHLSKEVLMKLMLFHAPLEEDEEISHGIQRLFNYLCEEVKFDRSLLDDTDSQYYDKWLEEDQNILYFLREMFDIRKFEKYSRIWILNCFDCSDDQSGTTAFGTYFTSTFINHSCLPNSVWHIDSEGHLNIMARSNIRKREEITLAYLSDMDLLSPAVVRIRELEATKHFHCVCPRCTAAADLSRGIRCRNCHTGQWFMATDADFLALSNHDLSPQAILLSAVQSECRFKTEETDGFMPDKLPKPLWRDLTNIESLRFNTSAQINWLKKTPPHKCLSCGYVPSELEITEAMTVENYLHSVHQRLESIEDEELAQTVSQCRSFCGQHYYYTELLTARAARTLPVEPVASRIQTELRSTMYASMAPVLLGTLAWSRLDIFTAELACLDVVSEDDMELEFRQMDRSTLESLYEVRDLVFKKCLEALMVLKLLFSSKAEYFEQPYSRIMSCWIALEKEMERNGNERHNQNRRISLPESHISEALSQLAS